MTGVLPLHLSAAYPCWVLGGGGVGGSGGRYEGGAAGAFELAQGLKAWESVHYAGVMNAELQSALGLTLAAHHVNNVLCVNLQCSLRHDQVPDDIGVKQVELNMCCAAECIPC